MIDGGGSHAVAVSLRLIRGNEQFATSAAVSLNQHQFRKKGVTSPSRIRTYNLAVNSRSLYR